MHVFASVWWPGVSKAIEDFVQSCPVCEKTVIQPREPLVSSSLPNYPWERIAADMFELKGSTYLLVVDYFSRFMEVQKLRIYNYFFKCSNSVEEYFCKIWNSPYCTMIMDNGPQFDSKEMKEFSQSYGFQHITTSPYYPQANGLAERTVKTVKTLSENSSDPYRALLSYHTTPIPWCALSPVELLMGTTIRTDVPQFKDKLIPK